LALEVAHRVDDLLDPGVGRGHLLERLEELAAHRKAGSTYGREADREDLADLLHAVAERGHVVRGTSGGARELRGVTEIGQLQGA